MSSGSLASELWKAWALPWKLPTMDEGKPMSLRAAWIAFTAALSEAPGARLNEKVMAGKAALVGEDQRRNRLRIKRHECRQWHGLAAGRGLDVQLGKRVERALQLREDLKDHLVGVQLREELRDLLLAEGIRKNGVDRSG